MVKNFLHFLKHISGWAPSRVVRILSNGVVVIECAECGKITYLE